MTIRTLLLIGIALPLLGACVVQPYNDGGAYYGDAYPRQTYIEYNNSYSHRGGYRENYWAHDREREERYHNDRPEHDDRRDDRDWRSRR